MMRLGFPLGDYQQIKATASLRTHNIDLQLLVNGHTFLRDSTDNPCFQRSSLMKGKRMAWQPQLHWDGSVAMLFFFLHAVPWDGYLRRSLSFLKRPSRPLATLSVVHIPSAKTRMDLFHLLPAPSFFLPSRTWWRCRATIICCTLWQIGDPTPTSIYARRMALISEPSHLPKVHLGAVSQVHQFARIAQACTPV